MNLFPLGCSSGRTYDGLIDFSLSTTSGCSKAAAIALKVNEKLLGQRSQKVFRTAYNSRLPMPTYSCLHRSQVKRDVNMERMLPTWKKG